MKIKNQLKNIITLIFAAVLFTMATGCKHTAHGVGEDMEDAGEKIQEKTR